jgi:hypothetical protein
MFDVRTNGKAVRWIEVIGVAFKRSAELFLRPTSPPSDVPKETGAESAVAQDKATATAEVEVGQAIQANSIPTISPDQQEIQRRRELVRALFNDFWNGRDDKPVKFVDRHNQAETYLNEQLTARGEPWQLDAKTRKMFGLPPRLN